MTTDVRLLPGEVAPVEARPGAQLHAIGLLLRSRWRLIALFTAGGLGLMALVTLASERLYTAVTLVHVENELPRVAQMDRVATGPGYLESVEYFQDQVNLLKSRTLVAAVARELGLEDDPRFWARPPGLLARAWGGALGLVARLGAPSAPGGEAVADPAPAAVPPRVINRYLAGLEVKPIPNSRLIQVQVTARDPDLARGIANAHAGEYIRRTLQSKFELTGAARKYLEQELERVRHEVDASEEALDHFRREQRMVAPDDVQGNAVVDRLGDLTRRLTRAQAQRIELEAQHQLVQSRDYEALPAVLQSGLIQTLKADLARLESREAELARLFLGGNPELQQVQAQVRQARIRLQREVERAVSGVESQYLAAQATESALRAELERQQATVLDLRERSGQYVKLDQAVQANRQLHAALLQRMGETDVVRGVQLSNIAVLDPAERPGEPSSPRTVLNLLFGLVLGLVLGVGTAALLENVDSSLRTPADVEQCLALPTLGVIPDFQRVGGTARRLRDLRREGTRPGEGGVVAPPAGRSLAAEVFRTLRTSILFFDPKHPPRSMLVTSAQAGEGKTATVVNLALSLAQLGARVLLVDADLRKPRCHHALGLPEGPGLTEYLLGEVEIPQVMRLLAVPGANGSGRPRTPAGAQLAFVQSGRIVHHTAELLSSARMRALLGAAMTNHDVVLVDSPPIFPVADASLLATQVDGVVLVVRGERTPRHVTLEAIGRLRFMQARVLGVVLNGVNPGAGEYSYRYSYYFRDAAEA
jgi:capsular exopolysaccharide synthesis family protein